MQNMEIAEDLVLLSLSLLTAIYLFMQSMCTNGVKQLTGINANTCVGIILEHLYLKVLLKHSEFSHLLNLLLGSLLLLFFFQDCELSRSPRC